jgi:hypothetical protein
MGRAPTPGGATSAPQAGGFASPHRIGAVVAAAPARPALRPFRDAFVHA